jgi:hypothetical protein
MYGWALENNVFTASFGARTELVTFRVSTRLHFALGFSKLVSFKFIPSYYFFFIIPDWPNVKFRCSLIDPQVRIVNILTPLASIYVTLSHCRHSCELLHASY